MNLNDISQSAQGGAGLQNLASQFGLSPEQTQAAVQAIIPALSHGLQRAAQNPGSLSGVVNEIQNDDHAGSYADPAQTAGAADAGTGALGQIFGGPGVTNQVAAQISRVSGLSPEIVASLLPAVTSMVMGGLAHAMNTQGQGAALNNDAPAGGGGGLFGSLVSAVTGALGGGGLQGGLGTLINMFEPGMAVSPDHAQALNQILPK
jgi:hypothetical protein